MRTEPGFGERGAGSGERVVGVSAIRVGVWGGEVRAEVGMELAIWVAGAWLGVVGGSEGASVGTAWVVDDSVGVVLLTRESGGAVSFAVPGMLLDPCTDVQAKDNRVTMRSRKGFCNMKRR
ncbi:MAG: hypothetical protein M3220_11475 [Chloroflexota bacterium]|nr:hypothetical protein [Chloroflexota bacterium]